MRDLWPFIALLKQRWTSIAFAFFFALITLLAGIGLLSLAGWFISAAAFAGLTALSGITFNFFMPSAGVRFFSLVRIGGRYCERLFSHDATFKILTTVRVWLYQRIEPIAPACLWRYRSSDLLNRLTSDVNSLDNLYLRILSPMLAAIFISLLMLFFFHFFSSFIAVFVFIMLLATAFAAPYISQRVARSTGEQLRHQTNALRSHIIDDVQNLTEILLFNLQQDITQQLANMNANMLALQLRMAHIKGLGMAAITLLTGTTFMVALYIGVNLVNLQLLNGANLALIVFGIMAAYEAIAPLPMAFQYLGETQTAAKRILAVTKEIAAVQFPESSLTQPQSASLNISSLNFQYPNSDKIILNGFNMTIAAGEHVALLGPNGCGKSTLVNLMARFWNPTAGEMRIGDVDITQLSEADLRNQFSILNQRPHIFNDSLRNNLLIAKPDASDEELFQALDTVELTDYVNNLNDGLDTQLNEAGTNMSGGQLRRIALARTVLHDAPIVILDEPTEGLDNVTSQRVLTKLKSLWANKTVLIITHRQRDLRFVERTVQI
tara:strand:- start:21094 stop:22743 length:1650 start_codon:yes stop_codon:yes gene_type:complete